MTAAYLLLEDGTRFDGESAGAPLAKGTVPLSSAGTGEVVFNTAMSGYQEAVTDPSYAGQIIVFTYPLIGNYGVARAHMESDRIHARAVIMREGVNREDAAHAEGGWLTWLADCGIPALSGVDTRALV
jgi:carbamoyl-phosphate synthase small subunit